MGLDPETDLVLTREIATPRALIYTCWTTPEHLVHWFVPKPHKLIACTLNVRVGGACNTTFLVEGSEMQNNGVYLEVIPNEKLVFTDTYTEGWKQRQCVIATKKLLNSTRQWDFMTAGASPPDSWKTMRGG
jgi:uncharacterized protein YndB with AHSA1/START domain